MQLMTLGYEGLTSPKFFSILRKNEVETLIDVRELPISRKPGFSKASLEQAALRRNMRYLHISALGCPREIRHDYRLDDDWAKYTRRFKTYLRYQQDAINELVGEVERSQCCLMCFETDPSFCHRSYVAAKVATIFGPRLQIVHLTDPIQARVAGLQFALA